MALTTRCIAGSSAWGSRCVQGADGREGGLAEKGPPAASRVVQGGSVRRVRLCHRACHQAADGRLLRLAAGSSMLRPVPPSARRGVAWGSGRGHLRRVRNERGVPQVHEDPQEGRTLRAR